MKRDTNRPVLRGPYGTAYATPRQAEVLKLAARGLGDKEIAGYLGISRRTVVDRFDELRERTGARTRAELLARAAEAGLVNVARDSSADLPHSRGQPSDTARAAQRSDKTMPQGYPQGFVDNEPLSFVADKDVKRPTHGHSRSNSQPAANDHQQGLTQDVLNVLHQMRSARDRLDDKWRPARWCTDRPG